MTWEEYQNLDKNTQEWAKKIAEADGRSAHPEEYVGLVEQLLATENPTLNFEKVVAKHDDTSCHTDMYYSFLDFWGVVVGDPRF